MKSVVWQQWENKIRSLLPRNRMQSKGQSNRSSTQDKPAGNPQTHGQHFCDARGKEKKKAEPRGKWRHHLGEVGVEWGIWKVIPHNLWLLPISWLQQWEWAGQGCSAWQGSRAGRELCLGKGWEGSTERLMTSTDRLWVSIDYWGACYLLAFHIHNEN